MGLFDRFKKKKTETAAEQKPVKAPTKVKPVKPLSDTKKAKKPIPAPVVQTKPRTIKVMPGAERLLIKPVITEKATSLSQYGQYVFEVPISANRTQIAQAIQSVYKVTPAKVNIINVSGKNVHYGQNEGWTKDRKKAIVTLREGESIKIHDGV